MIDKLPRINRFDNVAEVMRAVATNRDKVNEVVEFVNARFGDNGTIEKDAPVVEGTVIEPEEQLDLVEPVKPVVKKTTRKKASKPRAKRSA